jgi:hypothetical protein
MSAACTGLDAPQREFVKLIRANANRQRLHEVFQDFCELSALSISNAADLSRYTTREARYTEIIGRYDSNEVARFPRMLAYIVESLTNHLHDALGSLFMHLELGDHWKGQFFTPYELSKLMASINIQNAQALIDTRGFFRVMEPACGAGGMLIAVAETIYETGINYQQHMHATAIDIDATAVHMTYIQAALLHMPAIVVHGNALHPEKTWDRWVTPAHVLGGWDWKLREAQQADAQSETLERAQAIGASPPANAAEPIDLVRRDHTAGQLALF